MTEVPRCGEDRRGWPPCAAVTRPGFHQGSQDSIEVFRRALAVFFFLRGFCSIGIEQQFPECVPWGFNRCYEVRELRRASQDWEAQSQIGQSGSFTAGLSELHLHHVGGTLQAGAGRWRRRWGTKHFPGPLATGSSSSQSFAWGRHFENGWNWSCRGPPPPPGRG